MSPVIVTLRVVDGPDRGIVFDDLRPTIKIGREEGNTVRLRDERASRFHAKIHEDAGEILITDLESTNGTWVNGEPVQIAPLNPGDRIMIGRSVLVIDYHRPDVPDEKTIDQQATFLLGGDATDEMPEEMSTPVLELIQQQADATAAAKDQERTPTGPPAAQRAKLPRLPQGLSPGQTAGLARIFDTLHKQLAPILSEARVDQATKTVHLSPQQWQQVLELAWMLSTYYRRLVEPDT